LKFDDGLPTTLFYQEFTLVAECYDTHEDQRTASATHTVCPESDSDKREQGCNSAYSKDDLISLRNNIGDRKHSCSKTTLGRDHGRLAAKHLDVRFGTWWRGIQTAKGHEQKWKTWTTTHCCIETSTGLGPRYRYEDFGSN
jgi:hypothetical protein